MNTNTCATVVPRAGELSYSRVLRGVVTFRTGLRERGLRKGNTRRFEFVAAEGFEVLRDEVTNTLNDKQFGANPQLSENGAIFFKATKNARQAGFKVLSSANMWQLLRARWACITDVDLSALTSKGEAPESVFEFEFFVYLVLPPKTKATLRRATIERVSAAAEAVVTMQERSGVHLGSIAAHLIAVLHARQPDGTPLEIPDDNATRQARALDKAMEQTPQAETVEHDETSIEVQIFGVWVNMPVRVSSLRRALRLPQHDIFTKGIFHGFTLQTGEPRGEDVQDADHANADMPFES